MNGFFASVGRRDDGSISLVRYGVEGERGARAAIMCFPERSSCRYEVRVGGRFRGHVETLRAADAWVCRSIGVAKWEPSANANLDALS